MAAKQVKEERCEGRKGWKEVKKERKEGSLGRKEGSQGRKEEMYKGKKVEKERIKERNEVMVRRTAVREVMVEKK